MHGSLERMSAGDRKQGINKLKHVCPYIKSHHHIHDQSFYKESSTMIWKLYICILVIYLSTVANIVNGQDRPMIDIKVLQGGDGGECALIKERERALNEIHQEVYSSLENTYTCNGTPGWRRVDFINMTDTNDTCINTCCNVFNVLNSV